MNGNGPVVEAIAADVRDYILRHILRGDTAESLADDDLLLEGGIVDSGSVMTLVLYLEDRFGIRVEDDDLVALNFATIARIAEFVAEKGEAPCVSS
ncbi:MAG: acyl carrier protein [marine benthic group bacterium]|jgi:acyl carrier protein|nr:acyl carrier protein [Gemmatimonadota bacterium]